LCKEFELQEPQFILREFETKVVFLIHGFDEVLSRILKLASDNGAVTSGEIVKNFGVSKDTANRYLRKLIAENTLKRVGNGRSTKYIL
jgi:predicted HTH transcriptional regulator